MDRAGVLAALVAQAERPPNSAVQDMVTLRAVIEEASEMGAQRALARIGLSDTQAGEDIEELRELLGAWRAAKKSAVKSVMFNALSTTTTGGEGLRDLLTRALSKCHMARPAKQGS